MIPHFNEITLLCMVRDDVNRKGEGESHGLLGQSLSLNFGISNQAIEIHSKNSTILGGGG